MSVNLEFKEYGDWLSQTKRSRE